MRKIYIPIDDKSLFVNIFNDNLSGHTPTVNTPIKQGNSLNTDVERIFMIPKQIDFNSDDFLTDFLNKNSKSTTKVTNVFIFDKISVNGIDVSIDKSFCMFVKEEIDPEKAQFGRQKLHYPTSISFSGIFEFDNKHVIKAISSSIYDYAFVVKGFFYDFDTDILDFNIDIVGYNQIPYSKVFIANKGVGNKYIQDFHDTFDNYDLESIALKKRFGFDYVNPSNYLEKLTLMKKQAFNFFESMFEKQNLEKTSEIYPYALFDLTYYENGKKRYAFVSYTSTKEFFFNFSIKQWQFIHQFSTLIDFYMIKDIYGNPTIEKYSYSDILEFSSSITSILIRK